MYAFWDLGLGSGGATWSVEQELSSNTLATIAWITFLFRVPAYPSLSIIFREEVRWSLSVSQIGPDVASKVSRIGVGLMLTGLKSEMDTAPLMDGDERRPQECSDPFLCICATGSGIRVTTAEIYIRRSQYLLDMN
ncbi:hypothetical protein EDD18DRAFT_1100559 [Armillaria luteobubalina]|uniref:Uncharacterized protein n=1 Tax=Armillaria luteobubalina TaxID=153913 RepID=A0AA39UT48_9AGAR|nr:hypothetical protein EDD18DRAFT_1100559 [Armillaria luteobubalina]